MASRDAILEHARELLDLDSFHDYGPMGLQVVGADEVTKIAASVSSSLEAFRRTKEAGAELLVVHHGQYWENEPRIVDLAMKRRLQALFDGDITLAAYHLARRAPGDRQQHHRRASWASRSRSASSSGASAGLWPSPPRWTSLRSAWRATGRPPQVFDGGPERSNAWP